MIILQAILKDVRDLKDNIYWGNIYKDAGVKEVIAATCEYQISKGLEAGVFYGSSGDKADLFEFCRAFAPWCRYYWLPCFLRRRLQR